MFLLMLVYEHDSGESIFRRVKRRDRSGLGVEFNFLFSSYKRAVFYKNASYDLRKQCLGNFRINFRFCSLLLRVIEKDDCVTN